MATKVQKYYKGSGSFSPFDSFPSSTYRNDILKYKPRSVLSNNPNFSKYYRANYFSSSKNYRRRLPARKRSSSKMSSTSSSTSSSPAPASVSPPPSSSSEAMASYATPPSSLPPSSPTSETKTCLKIDSQTCTSPKRRLPDGDNEENPITKKFKRALEEVNTTATIIDAVPASARTIDNDSHIDRRSNVRRFAMNVRKRRSLANKTSSEYKRMPTSAQRGMYNPNVLCYRNSLLQSLLHLPKFVNFLIEQHLPKHCVIEQQKCLACSLRILALKYWSPEFSSREFTVLLRRLETQFKSLRWEGSLSGEQMDADEQLSWVLSTMSEQLPEPSVSSLQAITQLGLESKITCAKCGNISANPMSERSLSIPLKPRIRGGSLSAYVKEYMEETIEGYRCEKCKKQGNVHRSQVIGHAPDILFVQLKRFGYDGSKDKLRLPIDLTLDLGPYRDAGNKDCLSYELTAFISHSGSLDWGHYVCDARGPDGRWNCFNDEQKSSSSVKQALESKLPYLLFYQRRQSK
ncbi:hypothetical protein ACMFMG_002588 [Clarireedia jacksonii]